MKLKILTATVAVLLVLLAVNSAVTNAQIEPTTTNPETGLPELPDVNVKLPQVVPTIDIGSRVQDVMDLWDISGVLDIFNVAEAGAMVDNCVNLTADLTNNLFPALISSCFSVISTGVSALMSSGGLLSGLLGLGVSISDAALSGLVDVAMACGFTVTGILGMGIVGLILGVVNLAFNVINFLYTTGVGGISIAAVLISIIAVFISVVMSIFLSVLVLINFAMLFLSGLLFSILIGGLFLLIFAITTTILAIGIVVLKLQQLATTGLSFPFGFVSLITIISAIPEILSLILPLGISWLAVIAYPFIWLLGVLSMFPVIGFGIIIVALSLGLGLGIPAIGLVIAFIIFLVGTGLSIILGIVGIIAGIIIGVILAALSVLLIWINPIFIITGFLWIIIIFLIGIVGGAFIGGVLPFAIVVLLALVIAAIFVGGGLLIGGGILLVGIILFIPSLIIGPILGFILLAVILPLLITGILFIFSFGWEIALIAWILLENIFSFITMVINFIGIFILQIFLQTIQTITISEIVSVIVLFINRIAESVPFGNVVGGILQTIIGLGMLTLASLFACFNIVLYPFNLCYNMGVRFCESVMFNVPVLDCRNWVRRPLGWQ